jgi:hypothetical protein
MAEPYSKSEIDLKLENSEQRTQLMFQEMIARFDLIDKDINWLKIIVTVAMIPGTLAIVGLMIAIASMLTNFLRH